LLNVVSLALQVLLRSKASAIMVKCGELLIEDLQLILPDVDATIFVFEGMSQYEL